MTQLNFLEKKQERFQTRKKVSDMKHVNNVS
jgi:hypothetical protein